MTTPYSFQDVAATLTGPTGIIDLGYGATVSDEGITIEMRGDKNKMDIGADGKGMHSLSADKSGTVTARFLQTSPTNALLMAMYDAQALSPALWGQNVIVVRQTRSGDVHTANQCAFKKKPNVKYGKEGTMVEWTWDAIAIDSVLGTY